MGIYDRDYMRRDRLPSLPLGKLLLILAGTLGVLTVALTHCPAAKLATEAEPAKGSLRVNINTATQQELETIPNIGPARADAIINHRPYSSVDDLSTKHALGPTITNRIREFVKVDGNTEKITEKPKLNGDTSH